MKNVLSHNIAASKTTPLLTFSSQEVSVCDLLWTVDTEGSRSE